MNHNIPLSPRPLEHLSRTRPTVLSARQLREHGVTPEALAARCRPGGPWQEVLPRVYVLHRGRPTGDERVRAALLYAGREAMVTGLAALALHRFSSVPPLVGLARIDLLVTRQRRLRAIGDVGLVRAAALPRPQAVQGVPCAPLPRALADAVEELDDARAVRQVLTEAVRGGHCEATVLVGELSRARLLSRPQVMEAVDALVAEGRAIAENRLYTMVRSFGLPDPLWNVDLRLPGGPHLGGVDAYWPEHAVAVELDTRAHRREDDTMAAEHARKREHLERLGITVVHITPRKLRESLEQQATVVRTALMAAADRTPASWVVVLPR
ncbi:hypothetical protein PV392_03955 [Streptomyces sp. ME03-5709C]|nr:hypothetical protein [Streptomyces sp. ME03-5709C]